MLVILFSVSPEKQFPAAGGHRDQRGAGEFAHEAGRERRGLLRQRDRGHDGE